MKLIRWQEMPDFEIYSDQLLTIVNQQLAFFPLEITNSMINNYVKQKVMPLPVKKKYQKLHIARLIVLSLLKTAFSIDEIHRYLQSSPTENDYDRFCDIFESLWQNGTLALPTACEVTNDATALCLLTVISKQKALSLLTVKGNLSK